MSEGTNAPAATPDSRQDTVDRLEAALAGWRSRLDELIVQLDLATMDVKDALAQRLSAAENAGLALRSGLTYAGEDVAGGLSGPHDTVTKVLDDLHAAVESAKRAARGPGR